MSLIDRWKTLPSVDGARPYAQLLAEGSKFHCSIPIFHVSHDLLVQRIDELSVSDITIYR